MGDWNDISFSKLSNTERDDLISICSFQDKWEELLKHLWKITTSHKTNLPYCFDTLKDHIISNSVFLLHKLLTVKSSFQNGVWEFPKGRRENNETSLQCALRETEEEINITRDSVHITNHQLMYKNYQQWKYAYYVGNVSAFDAVNKHYDIGEISEIRWCSFHDALKLISSDMTERKNILRDVDINLRSKMKKTKN